MTSASVDARELKDAAAEFLQRSKFDKAAEVLEQLVHVEPKDMQHRLRLGDCYRRLKEIQKAIQQYEAVGRHYADEDQLIKAIAAFKVILEMDPRNAGARERLSRMNERRRSTGTRVASGLSRTKARSAGAPAKAEAIDLEEAATSAGDAAKQEMPDYGKELVFDDETEEFSTGKRTKYVIVPAPPRQAEAAASSLQEPAEIERLPTDAIVAPIREQPVAHPIADLLSSEGDEEVELLSHLEDAAPQEPVEQGSITQDIEAAVGAIAPPTTTTRRKLPTRVPLFEDLPREALVELVNRLSHLRYRAGEQILKEGERGRSFFVIVEGRVRIWKSFSDAPEMELATLDEGAFFGEMALLSGAPRTANVSAQVDTELLEISDAVLRELTKKHPQVAQSLKNFYRRRLLDNVMAISPLFKDFDPSERPHIVEKFRLRQAAPGEMVIKEGTPSDGLYVVLHGSVEVVAKNVALAKLKEGDVFGEMSLLKREPASATVTSSVNSILLRLAREKFQELVVTHPQILALVSELTEQRAAATRAALERHSISSFV